MGSRVSIQIDPADKILLKRHLNDNGDAQKFFTHEVRRMCAPYVPHLTGTLESTAVESTDAITYVQPYARRQYYENSGRNRSMAPQAGKEWDKRMWADRGQEIIQSVAAYCGAEVDKG